MDLKPEELTERGYVELDRLDHQQLPPFIRQYLGRWNAYTVSYYIANLLALAGVVWVFLKVAPDTVPAVGDRFTRLSYGLALAFLLVPLHEYLHVLAYRSQGARQTSYGANLRKLYFMAIADRFVANEREFRIVALTPFVVITALLVLSLPFLNPAWQLTISGTLLTHTAMCSGDFGLLSFFAAHRKDGVVTFDDQPAGMTWFLGRKDSL
ncbi:MAG: DUF3267 domain-containing protein [Bacteroidia bacterium]|nr:DUF3267 domain-containing protein [Bacteroidia bacterium]MBP7437297.1 DUF3267 domain-containing protein [Bacteroidia bacterium]MBP7728504.1 DUF3267 domain-containing protein [Bacteroidia bacterium]MBP7772449.1 DUF3267 domain-containing protein [Bacteroidia bacterium]